LRYGKRRFGLTTSIDVDSNPRTNLRHFVRNRLAFEAMHACRNKPKMLNRPTRAMAIFQDERLA